MNGTVSRQFVTARAARPPRRVNWLPGSRSVAGLACMNRSGADVSDIRRALAQMIKFNIDPGALAPGIQRIVVVTNFRGEGGEVRTYNWKVIVEQFENTRLYRKTRFIHSFDLGQVSRTVRRDN